MLKLYLKKEHLSFTNTWMTTEKEMMLNIPDEDVLQKLFEGIDPQRAMEEVIRLIDD